MMRMRGVRIAYCVIFIGAVFASDSTELLYEDSPEEDAVYCSKSDLSLNFSNTVITTIGSNFISSPLITCLDLQKNDIERVDEGALDGVPALEYLNMAGNRLSSLMSFGGHENLKTLILANQYCRDCYYRFTRELTDIVGQYPELRYLDLSHNSIILSPQTSSSIYDDASYFHRIRVQKSIKFPKLKYLDLSKNKISIIRDSFLPLNVNRNLTHLYLHENSIEEADLTAFNNLIVLTLNDNQIQGLRTDCYSRSGLCIRDMSRLKYFTINNNKLTSIDRDFFMMPELVSLNISNNFLEEGLMGKFDKLYSLQDLSADDNQLTSMSIISKTSKLSSLSLNRNKIKFISSEDLGYVPLLKKLYLNDNKISDIHVKAFSEMEILEELHLANNLLTELPAEWCNNLRSLRYLDLTNNKFKYLESLSLSEVLPLIEIDLIGNSLLNLKAKTLHDLPENVTIHLILERNELEPNVL